ncbi:MAG: hypothetical protein MSG64_13545 [Pyrinomonadaceae bacterium MAG19_C2-C3]|nr:hypothetical protein [Pyrinomonadaceae bacterium MAG19_C2-C3]
MTKNLCLLHTSSASQALFVWTLRDAPVSLLDEVFECDAEMRDRFLRDWSGGDLLIAVAWELCVRGQTLRMLESLMTRLTEHGEQDVHWYALRPARLSDSMYAVFYANFDTDITLESFTHDCGCLCAFCSRGRGECNDPEREGSVLATKLIM